MATKLTNIQIKNLVNEAYKQATGLEEVDTIDLSQFVDNGTTEVQALRSRFTGALIGAVTKNIFLESKYSDQVNDPFYEDEARFGAITQLISVEAPEVKENSAWNDFVNGTTQVGQYTVYLPVVSTKYYTKTSSWALPITITNEQWDSAFRGESELEGFVEYVFMTVDNKVAEHRENMNALNRNNFIAEKLNAQADEDVDGVHAINLVEAFCKEYGVESMTVAEFKKGKDTMNFAGETFENYMGYLAKQSAIFNTDNKVRFTPKDRLVVQVLRAFEKKVEVNATSNTFHDAMVGLPLHDVVASWQGLDDTSFDKVSSIDIKTASGQTVTKSNIVALMCDKWAILHTIRKQRVGSQYFGIENLTHYEYQFRDAYMNNLSMNGVVFYLEDYTA